MITTSAQFTTAIKDTVRRIRGKVQITWRAATIDPLITVDFPGANRGNPVQNKQVADEITLATRKWAHLDGIIKADGTYYPMPSDAQAAYSQVGCYGADRCNGSAQWSSPYPTITVNFEIGPIFALRVYGDQIYNEYPVDFDIKIYDASDTLLYTEPVTGNTLLNWSKDISDQGIYNAKYMELILKKWSAPNRVGKILEFYSPIVEEYTGDDIVSMNLLEEREISDGTLPVGNISANELDLELQNVGLKISGSLVKDPFSYENSLSPYENVLKLNRKITAWVGAKLPDTSIEYVKLGHFWSGDWKASERDSTVSTSARDRMELLRKAEFSESLIYANITAYDLLETVLNHAKANVSWLSDMTWNIASELDNPVYTIPVAFFPRQSYFECIRQVVEACMAQAYMSRDDVLIITGPSFAGNTTGYSITRDDYFDKSQPSKSEEMRNLIRVPVTAITLQLQASEVYRSPNTISLASGEEKTINAEYSNQPVFSPAATLEDEDTGIAIEQADYYACSASIVIKNNGASSGSFNLVISGICFDKKHDEVEEASDAAKQLEFGILKYDYPANDLLQDRTMAQTIAAALLSVYKIWRKDVRLQWRGNPALELGDLIEVPEYKRFTVDKRANFLIYKNQITFDGALRAVTDGRKMSDA